MAVGLGAMRLSPAAFWAMTPAEFAAAVRGLWPERERPLGRGGLDELMRDFPDGEHGGSAS